MEPTAQSLRHEPATTSISREAERLRQVALAGPIGKRHSSFELYDLLDGCFNLALRCKREPDDASALRDLVAASPLAGRNRTYVERGSDEFSLVCRYVFSKLRSKSAERSNASRYAHCLREAHKRNIVQLGRFLREHGGVNGLFLRRPLAAVTVITKTLQLAQRITVPKDGTFSVTLQRTAENTYEVVGHSPEVAIVEA